MKRCPSCGVWILPLRAIAGVGISRCRRCGVWLERVYPRFWYPLLIVGAWLAWHGFERVLSGDLAFAVSVACAFAIDWYAAVLKSLR